VRRHLLMPPPWSTMVFPVLLFMETAAAQTVGESQGRQIPYLSTTARAAALGDASGALLGGIEGLPSNPGVLAWLKGTRVEYSFHRVSPEAALQHVAAGFRTGGSSGLALHLDILHYGGYDFFSQKEIRDRGFELNGGASWATMFTDDLSGGLTVSVLNATTDADPVQSVTADFGLSYAPGRYHRFGFSVRGFGTDYDIVSPVIPPDVPDPRPSRTISLQAVFDYPLDAGGQRLIVVFENDKMIGRQGLLYKTGVEYQPLTAVMLRGGIQIRDNDVEPRGGLGTAVGPFALDYAYRFHRGDGPSHVFTLTFSRD